MQNMIKIEVSIASRLVWLMLSLCATASAQTDSDSDGLSDSVETNTGIYVSPTSTGTNPNNPDTDGDGAGDWYEIKASFTNPFQSSSKPRVPYPLPDPNTSTGATNKRVKVYIMSGQSNMLGFGTMAGTTDKSLETFARTGKKFPDLVNASNGWTTRKDVRYRGVISDITNAELSPTNLGTHFGPELGFGYVMGWFHDEPVLLLKSCTGNRSLGWDILPKGSPGYGNPIPTSPGAWYGGKEYDRFFMDEEEWAHPDTAATNVVDVLDNFGTQYPAWATQGFEIAGFVWWQGDKDRYNTSHANSYEANLVRLINSLRSYYTNRYPGRVVLNAPFVLATLGQTTPSTTDPEDKAIFNGQRAVDGSTGKYPQFAGNVKTVYAHPLSEGGASNDHYQERAGTYLLVGDALGRAMVDLLSTSSPASQLAALTTSSGALTPAFVGSTFAFSASVSTPSITVTPTLAGAAITVNGSPVTSGTASAPIPLSIGANPITIASTVSGSTSTYTLTITRTQITYTWAIDQTGPSAWSTSTNWTPNTGIPNGIDALAALTNNITTDNQISLTGPITLGGLNIGDSVGDNAFTINGGHPLTFDVMTSSATLSRLATGASIDTIGTAVILADPLTVDVSNTTGSLNINGAISETGGARALTKTGSGALILNGNNTFTGVTRITAGTLQAATLANGSSNSSIGASSNAVGNLILNGGTLRYTGAAVSTNRLFSLQASSSIDASGTGAVSFTNTGAMGFNGGTAEKTLTLTGNNTGANTLAAIIGNNTGATSLTKSGIGTWVLSGLSSTAASNYSGPTMIDNGTLRITTTNPSFTGGLTFGSAAGSTNVGNLDLSTANATFAGAFLARTNSTNAHTITIGSGRTLQLNGAFTVGHNTTALPHSTTELDVTGAGTLSIGTSSTPTNASIQIANGSTTNVGNSGVLDMSGLSNFFANLGTGSFRVGSPTNVGSANGGGSTVSLAANSTIQAATLLLGSPDGAAGGATAIQSLKLGSGATVINVDTLNLGGIGTADGRSNGSLTFSGPTGTLRIRSQADPVNGRTNLNVGTVNMNTGVPQPNNLFDTTGHSADLRFGTINLGFRTAGTSLTTAQFEFDAGTLDANDLTAGSRGGSAGANATATGIVTLGGGTVTINNNTGPIQLGVNTLGTGTAAGTLTISGGSTTVAANAGNSIRLGNAAAASGTANGTLNLTGGTLTVAGDIIRGAATGTVNSTLSLAGGTLDMTGRNITNLTSITYSAGTLRNLGTLNTGMTLAGTGSRVFDQGTGISGNIQSVIQGTGIGLTKQGPGSLTLSGLNTYTGDTTVNGGTLTLADNAQLMFVIGNTSGTSNRITGTGTLTLNGDFNINTTLTDASALSSGSWALVNASTLTETYGTSFTITGPGWSESANVWTKTVGTKIYTFSEATGILTLTSAASYDAWIGGYFPGASDQAIIGSDRDPDQDGIPNSVEMVLGGNPQLSTDTALLPTFERVTDPVTTPAMPAGDYLLFTYRHSAHSSNAGIAAACEMNRDLSGPWIPAADAPGVVIQVDNDFVFTPPAATPTDRVRVYVPRASNATQFGRLKVVVP